MDKSKKIGYKDKSSPSQDLSHAYAVLDNIKQNNSERNGMGGWEIFTTEDAIQLNFITVPIFE